MLNLLIIIQVKCNYSDCNTKDTTHAYYLSPAILPKISGGTVGINHLTLKYLKTKKIYSVINKVQCAVALQAATLIAI